jgi:hypothetical protein
MLSWNFDAKCQEGREATRLAKGGSGSLVFEFSAIGSCAEQR